MNVQRRSPWTRRQELALRQRQPVLPVARTLGTLDSLTRTFNSQHLPEHMSDSDRKSLLMYQIKELAAAAPDAFKDEALRLAGYVDELDGLQAERRHAHASQKTTTPADDEARPRSEALARDIHAVCADLSERAYKKLTPLAVGQAYHADRKCPAHLAEFPATRTYADKSNQVALLERLGAQLHEIHNLTSFVHKGSSLEDWERTQTRRVLRRYITGGGDMQQRDPALYVRLHAHYMEPNYRHTAALAEAVDADCRQLELSNGHGQMPEQLPHRLVRAYKEDRADIRERQRKGELHGEDPLQQRSATLDMVYLTRWQHLAQRLTNESWDRRHALANPAVIGDPESHVVAQIVQASAVKVPSPHRETQVS